MTEEDFVVHDVQGHFGESKPPNRGFWYTLAAIVFFALLAILL